MSLKQYRRLYFEPIQRHLSFKVPSDCRHDLRKTFQVFMDSLIAPFRFDILEKCILAYPVPITSCYSNRSCQSVGIYVVVPFIKTLVY